MKTFLEEYGFVILIAIVIILLIVMATPVGNTIKASVLGLVDRFSGTATSKLDNSKTERTTTLNGSTLTIVSDSETDKFVAILHGVQGGKEVSKLSDTNGKIECTPTMTNTASFDGIDVANAIETTDGTAMFEIKNPENLDEGSKYYLEIMNIGTGEIFKSEVSTVDYAKMNTIGGGSGGSGGTVDNSNINVAGVEGDFSTPGNLVTIDSKQYRVLAVSGTQVKVMSMVNVGNSKFDSSGATTSFGSYTGQKYEGSVLDQAMTTYYNSLPSVIQNAIVEQNINQSMYSWSNSMATANRKGEAIVGARKVYALDVDDVIEYLGAGYTKNSLMKMFFDIDASKVSDRIVWLRSANSDNSNYAFNVNGNYGSLNNSYCNLSYEVRPAFVLDLSLLS